MPSPEAVAYYVFYDRLVHHVMANSIQASLRYKHNRHRPHMVMTWCQVVVDLDKIQMRGVANCLVCVSKLDTTSA